MIADRNDIGGVLTVSTPGGAKLPKEQRKRRGMRDGFVLKWWEVTSVILDCLRYTGKHWKLRTTCCGRSAVGRRCRWMIFGEAARMEVGND